MDGGSKPERGRAESVGKEGKGVTKEKRRNEWRTADRGTQWRAGLDRGHRGAGLGDSWDKGEHHSRN